jgi:hypothetical protein
MKFKTVTEDEINDARCCAERRGYRFREFSFDEVDLSAQSIGIHLILGKLRVSRGGDGGVREYTTGHSSAWPTEFCRDLDAGVFGDPATER